MARGIIYLMSTAVAGLVKIGKTGSGNYAERMRFLEGNGYANVTGLKREFAIEVEDYDAKEALIDEIFAKARVGTSELFALDVDLAKQLLAAFEGTQVTVRIMTVSIMDLVFLSFSITFCVISFSSISIYAALSAAMLMSGRGISFSCFAHPASINPASNVVINPLMVFVFLSAKICKTCLKAKNKVSWGLECVIHWLIIC